MRSGFLVSDASATAPLTNSLIPISVRTKTIELSNNDLKGAFEISLKIFLSVDLIKVSASDKVETSKAISTGMVGENVPVSMSAHKLLVLVHMLRVNTMLCQTSFGQSVCGIFQFEREERTRNLADALGADGSTMTLKSFVLSPRLF